MLHVVFSEWKKSIYLNNNNIKLSIIPSSTNKIKKKQNKKKKTPDYHYHSLVPNHVKTVT